MNLMKPKIAFIRPVMKKTFYTTDDENKITKSCVKLDSYFLLLSTIMFFLIKMSTWKQAA